MSITRRVDPREQEAGTTDPLEPFHYSIKHNNMLYLLTEEVFRGLVRQTESV